jgi:hypothetical protein
VRDLAVVTTSNGVHLFAAALGALYEWNGSEWIEHGGLRKEPTCVNCTFVADVISLEVFQGNLYVGGAFDWANSQRVNSLTIWNEDGTWTVLDELLGYGSQLP